VTKARCWVLLAVLAACGHSAPTHLFTLSADATTSAARYDGPPVQLDSVLMPPGLDGARIVRRAGPNELEARDTEQWSAPLGQLVRQTLTEDLAARLPAGAVIYPDAPRPEPTLDIIVDVLRCEETGSGLAVDASWSVLKADRSGLAYRGERRITRAGAGEAHAMAQELSGSLSELADAIVEELVARRLPAR
jgi:uncharacterized lipoprotein YmbA